MPFEPQTGDIPVIPLSRYLPTCPPGILGGWLSKNIPKGSWVLDPFGSTPEVALQAAQAGYRVLVAAINPLLVFGLQLLSSGQTPLDFQTALADLASTRRGDQRIEVQIQSLYLTHCVSCGREIQAEGFLWKKGETGPYARLYTCPYCGDEGVHPITEEDLARLIPLQRAEPLHRARAIEKVLATDAENDLKQKIKEAVQIYPVRPLVVLFTLLNKLESLLLSDEKRRSLQGLVISALEAGTSLWSWPPAKETHRLMSTPPEYLEKNLWMEVEKAVEVWVQPGREVKCTIWPDQPGGAGICIYPGRMKTLRDADQSIIPSAVLCVFPRPNQAFWTLSALWSAWIWGKEKAANYVNVLNRRRFDWLWHSRALHSPLSAAAAIVPEGTLFFGLLPEAVPALILAAGVAASSSNLEPVGFAVKADSSIVQFQWKSTPVMEEKPTLNLQNTAREIIRECYMELGQPASSLPAYTSAVIHLASMHQLPSSQDQITAERFSELQLTLQKIFLDQNFMIHYDSAAQDIEPGEWGLANFGSVQDPLDDRVEKVISEFFQRQNEHTFFEIREEIYHRLPGILIPSDALLINTLKSYAEYDPEEKFWRLRPGEDAAKREHEINEISTLLTKTGIKLGFKQLENQLLTWEVAGREYRFHLSTNTALYPFFRNEAADSIHQVFVFPGSRSALLDYKINHNPQLKQQVSQNWHFLKFRYVRELSQREDLTPELWPFLLDSDPISPEKETQLRIFF